MTTPHLTGKRMAILKAALRVRICQERYKRFADDMEAAEKEMGALWDRELAHERQLSDLLGQPATPTTASVILEAAGPEAVAAATAALEAEARAT